MAKRIVDTSKTYRRINDTSKTLPKVDPEQVAKALGAEKVGTAPHPMDPIHLYTFMREFGPGGERARRRQQQQAEQTSESEQPDPAAELQAKLEHIAAASATGEFRPTADQVGRVLLAYFLGFDKPAELKSTG